MTTKININFVRGPQQLHFQLQSIEVQLDTIQSIQEVSKLTRELDSASTALKEMRVKAQDVFGQSRNDPFKGLEEEIVHMYGRIEEAFVRRKISQIQLEANSIKELMANGGTVDIKAVHALKRHIFRFLKDYRPSIKDRQVIADARRTVEEACQSFKAGSQKNSTISHFDWLTTQCNVRLVEEIGLDPSLYEDLFDIAALVYNGKMREARSGYNQLSEHVKQMVLQHLRHLTATAFDDRLETIQALLATAHQLLGTQEPYATSDEIDEIFLGLSDIMEHEEKSPVIPLKIPS